MTQATADIYERITAQIIEAIEAGAGSYRMPWHVTNADVFAPVNAAADRRYRGINVLVLWAAAQHHGFASGFWATYRQWQELGAQVRKGEKATPVVFWTVPESDRGESTDEAGAEKEKPSRGIFARGYSVFNSDQVDGYTRPERPVLPESERIAAAEKCFSAVGATVRHGGGVACYNPAEDLIYIPEFSSFRDAACYYSTLGHEATHWTGAPHRLNRDTPSRFGSEGYAMEELVAELGAAFLCTTLGIANEPRPDHAAYIASWLDVLRQNKRAIFTAASQAQKAVDWMTEQGEHQAKAA